MISLTSTTSCLAAPVIRVWDIVAIATVPPMTVGPVTLGAGTRP